MASSNTYLITTEIKKYLQEQIPKIYLEQDWYCSPSAYYGHNQWQVRVYTINRKKRVRIEGHVNVKIDKLDELIASLPKDAKYDLNVYRSGSYHFSLKGPAKSAEVMNRLTKGTSISVSYDYYQDIPLDVLEQVKASHEEIKARRKRLEDNHKKKLERERARREKEMEEARIRADASIKALTVAQALEVLSKAGVEVSVKGDY